MPDTLEGVSASLDEFATQLIADANALATEQLEAVKAIQAKWDALVGTVPEGRLQTLQEYTSVKVSADQAKRMTEDCASQVQRFEHLANPTVPPLMP